MAYDGHIVCSNRKCHRVLYLGKHKDGQFWPGKVDREQFATGMRMFIEEHFAHGTLMIFGDAPYERYLDSCPDNEWPLTVFVEVDEASGVRLVDQEWSSRG